MDTYGNWVDTLWGRLCGYFIERLGGYFIIWLVNIVCKHKGWVDNILWKVGLYIAGKLGGYFMRRMDGWGGLVDSLCKGWEDKTLWEC